MVNKTDKKKFQIIFLVINMIIFTFCVGFYIYDDFHKKYSSEQFVKKEKDNLDLIQTNDNKVYDLPLVAIETKGNVVNGDNRVPATIRIYDSKDGMNKLSDNPSNQFDIMIKFRGNSTRKLPKKQFSIKIGTEEKEESEEILGMNKNSDWVLNAPFEDKSFLRDALAYNVSRNIMDFAPDTRFCELFITDSFSNLSSESYNGIYLFMEGINRGEDRVDIQKQLQDEDDISFIVAKNRAKGDDLELTNYGSEVYLYDYGLVLEYPKKEVTEHDVDSINKHISEFERVLYSDKYDVDNEGYEQYIDVDSFIDYYLINEFFRNTDAGILSTYIHKDYGEKIKAGPVWDFNASMGNSGQISPYLDYTGMYMASTSWFERLLSDKEFVLKVIARYEILRQSYFSEKYLISFIDKNSEVLKRAAKRNFEKWPIDLCNYSDFFKRYYNVDENGNENIYNIEKYIKNNRELLKNPEIIKKSSVLDYVENMATSYDEEIKMLKVFLINRGNWLDKNIKELLKFTE